MELRTMIDESGSSAQERFTRQRRNLIAVSLIVVFYKVAGLQIDTINLLGNRAFISSPDVIFHTLSLLFIYLSWRFYTATREVKGFRQFILECSTWAEGMCSLCLKKKYATEGIDDLRIDLIGRSFGSRTFAIRFGDDGGGGVDMVDRVKLNYLFRFFVAVSVAWVAVNTSKFSEYVLPFLLAGLAFLQIDVLQTSAWVLDVFVTLAQT